MGDFTIRADAVDVEQIMRQIRQRIREKRGVDYTEEEIRQLAQVRLERFLDPGNVRSDLVRHYRERSSGTFHLPASDNYAFEDHTIYYSGRGVGGGLINFIRRLLNPVLKLFFNPNPLIHVLHMQSRINDHQAQLFARIEEQFAVRKDLDALNYEVLNNLVVEMTRLGIDVKNVKMRLESIASRLDFDERRARALEGVVQYVPGARPGASAPAGPQPAPPAGADAAGPGGQRRRRRRRGRRRGGGTAGPEAGAAEGADHLPHADDAPASAGGDPRPPDEPADGPPEQ
jgi:hypothetical protein